MRSPLFDRDRLLYKKVGNPCSMDSNLCKGHNMSNLYKVFVYGTLKRNEPNHHCFSKNNGYYKFLTEARTTEKYPMVIATVNNVPYLLKKPGLGHFVHGEVYEVDDKVLEALDELEEHPDFYVRREYRVIQKDGEEDTVWIYMIEKFKESLLELPMLESYSNEGNHGLRYVVGYLKDASHSHRKAILS